jgi:hypothetical protein
MSQKSIFETANNTVACKPFKSAADGKERRKGDLGDFIAVSKKLEELDVVLEASWGNNNIMWAVRPNDKIFLKSDHRSQQWARTLFTAPGVDGEFILVPALEIVAINTRGEE